MEAKKLEKELARLESDENRALWSRYGA